MRRGITALTIAASFAGFACSALVGLNHDYFEVHADADIDAETDANTPPADAGNAGDASCDADLLRDPSNCGACGHACGAPAGCDAGACAPVLLRQGTFGPIAVDDEALWIIAEGAVGGLLRCPKPDCTAPTTVASLKSPTDVAALAGRGRAFVLASNGGAPPSHPLEVDPHGAGAIDCDPMPGAPNLGPQSLSAGPDRAFVAGDQGVFQCPDGCNNAGGAVCTPVVAAQPEKPSLTAFGGATLWWSDKVGIRACTPQSGFCAIASTLDVGIKGTALRLMAADDAAAYVADATGSVVAIEPTGTRHVVASFGAPPVALALDGTRVYLASTDAVRAAAKTGSTPVFVARGTSIAGLAASVSSSDPYVYFTDASGLWRVRK